MSFIHTFVVLKSHVKPPQRQLPALQVNPVGHGSLVPHLHVPESQVSVVPEQTGLLPHLHTPEVQTLLAPEHAGLLPHKHILDVQVSDVTVDTRHELLSSHPV